MEILNIKTPEEFYHDIEEIVWELDVNYIDAVVTYCERNSLEIESIAHLVKKSGSLKSRIAFDAESLNYMPKTSRLPI